MYIHIKYSYSFLILFFFMTHTYCQQAKFSRPMIAVEKQQPIYTIMLNDKKLLNPVIRDIIRIDIHERLDDAGNFIIKLNNRDNRKPSLNFSKSKPFRQGDKIEILLARNKNEPSRKLAKGTVTSVNKYSHKPDTTFLVIEAIVPKPDIKHLTITKSTVYKIDSSNRHLFTIEQEHANAQVNVTLSERNDANGLPELRAGRKIQLSGIGANYNGLYYIDEVTHTFNSSGYSQSFKLNRNGTNQ